MKKGMGYILGVLLGDATIEKGRNYKLYRIALACKDKDFAEYFFNIVKEVTNEEPTFHFRYNLYWARLNNIKWASIFKRYFDNLESTIEKLSKEEIRLLLKGFFDSDGSISYYRSFDHRYPVIAFYNTDIKNVNIINRLLEKLNYHPKKSKYSPRINNYEKKIQYSLRLLRKNEVVRFGKEIGSSIKRKQEVFNEIRTRSRSQWRHKRRL